MRSIGMRAIAMLGLILTLCVGGVAAAQTMNAPARWWTLLPRGVPIS